MAQQPLHPVLGETRAPILHHGGPTARPLGDPKAKVQRGRSRGYVPECCLEARCRESVVRRVLQLEEDLKERGLPGIALLGQHLHQIFEGDIRLSIGLNGSVPHTSQEFGERGRTHQGRPHDHRVAQATQQCLGFSGESIRHRDADGQVRLAGVAMQERLERREQDHEEGGPMCLGHAGQRRR